MCLLCSIKIANNSSNTIPTPLCSNSYIISSKHYFQYLKVNQSHHKPYFAYIKKSCYHWNLITVFLTSLNTLFYDYIKKKNVYLFSYEHLCHVKHSLINFHAAAESSTKFFSIYMTHWHTKYIRLMKKQVSGINHFETIQSKLVTWNRCNKLQTQLRALRQATESEHTFHLKIFTSLHSKIFLFTIDSICFNTFIGPHFCPK